VYRTAELSILATEPPFPIATQCTFLTATYTKHSFDVSDVWPSLAKCLPVTKVKTQKVCKDNYQLLCCLFSFLRLLILLPVYVFITDLPFIFSFGVNSQNVLHHYRVKFNWRKYAFLRSLSS